MKIAFAGTPEFASIILEALAGAAPRQALDERAIEVAAVFSQPARPKGRGQKLGRSAVEETARAMGGSVSTPVKWGHDEIKFLRSLNIDILVTAAYGIILPAAVLELPRLGALNVHASILPRWRGAAPIQRAIEAGDCVSGITVFKMDEGIDTGPVLATREVRIEPDETAAELTQRLAGLAAETLPAILQGYVAGEIKLVAQNKDEGSYARKLKKSDGDLTWRHPAAEIYRKHRAFAPWPGIVIDDLKLLQINPTLMEKKMSPGEILALDPLVVATSDGALRLDKVQRSGGRPITGAEYARGKRLKLGDFVNRINVL